MKVNINNLVKKFGSNTAVNINDFTICDGEILGLVGNNGAGKTTLFRLILDLLKADQGEVSLVCDDERTIYPEKDETWKMLAGAYIDEGFLIDFLTPEEYFAFIGKVNKLDKATIDKRIEMFNHFMGGEILGQKKLIRNLSSGNKQKVGIISAFINKPNLLILDEPFNFLDPSSQNILKNIIIEYNHENDATILISSHNLAHTFDICSRIVLLEHGNIIKDIQNENRSADKELEDYFNK
jgi:ABC-2 type transport system ATP-binding protein